ncbi:MAG: glycosyltransferase family 2 protein [Lachnospiraceae bacterium]|nr:glycosyltransferase family 2 protein [Lachnospiraceae bacterium]
MKKLISIGIPCFNEEGNVEKMYEAVTKEMNGLKEYDYEIIFADNDSKDKTQEILRRIAQKDKKVKVIINQTNFGASRSGINLFRNASGDAYLGLACDFQEPPEMIPTFLEEWKQGYDVVWGQKKKSKENAIKYACRKLYYSIINYFSDVKQLDQVVGFGLMDRRVLDTIAKTQEQDPEYSVRHLISEYGFRIKLIPYEQRERKCGKSSYSIGSYFHFAITSLCNTSVKPLHFLTAIGVVGGFFSFLVGLFYLVFKLIFWDSFNVGIAPVVIGLFFVSSIQLFSIGLLGEYIAVLVRRVTDKPLIIEKEKINFDE